MTPVSSSDRVQISLAMRNHFDLVPLAAAQLRRAGRKRRQQERRKAKKLRHANNTVSEVVHRWNEFGGLTSQQAVRFALLGIPWWQFALRFFVSAVARWTFRQLIEQYD